MIVIVTHQRVLNLDFSHVCLAEILHSDAAGHNNWLECMDCLGLKLREDATTARWLQVA